MKSIFALDERGSSYVTNMGDGVVMPKQGTCATSSQWYTASEKLLIMIELYVSDRGAAPWASSIGPVAFGQLNPPHLSPMPSLRFAMPACSYSSAARSAE